MDDTVLFEIEILEPLSDQDSSVTRDGQIVELFDLSVYVSTLNQEDKRRYAAKLLIVGCDCPYTIHEEYWCNGLNIAEKMPLVTNLDLVNYLLCSKSPYTHEDLKAYKGLEAYKRFLDGGIGSLCAISLLNKNLLMKAKVCHSMSVNDSPAQPWVAFNAAGVIIAGHCNCTAGLGEVCSHVATLLFAAVALVDMKNSVSRTELKCLWLDRYQKPTMVDKISQLNIGRNTVVHHDHVSEISEKEFQAYLQSLSKENNPSAILLVSDGFCQSYIPQQLKIPLPPPLGTLYDVKCHGLDLNILCEKTEDLMVKYAVTEEQSIRIEEITRMQSKSDLWHVYRQGRVTSSVVHSVGRTSITNPSKSLVQRICYPQTTVFQTEATKFGLDHEARAITKLEKLFFKHGVHEDFSIEPAGLFINVKQPHLAASPDRILRCSCSECLGIALIEVKCWFKHRHNKIRYAITVDHTLCLKIDENGKLNLPIDHPYYAQVQMQMHVCDVKLCYFVVYTLVDLVCLRISYNELYCAELAAKSKLFVLRVILPELTSKYYTVTRYNVSTDENNYMPCFCQKNLMNQEMIPCANKLCFARLYHKQCLLSLGMKVFRESWVCHICKKKTALAAKKQ